MTVLPCAALSAAMFYLAHGLNDVWVLAWFGPAPLLWLAYGNTPRWQLFAAALAAFAASQAYMAQAYGGDLPVAVILLSMFGPGAFFAIVMLAARQAWRILPPGLALLAFPVFWTGYEFLYSLVSPHGTFGSLAYSQVAWPAAIQIASLLGLHAITFMLCLFANALALAMRGARRVAVAGIALCAAGLVFGEVRLARPQAETMQVAALSDWQGRVKLMHKLDLTATRAAAQSYADAARAEIARGARLVVIPETALAVRPDWRDTALAPLAAAAQGSGAAIVAGVVMVKPWRNMAMTFQQGDLSVYDKRHLLPPFEDKFIPGPGPGLLGTGRAVAICKDLDFPRTLRADALAGAAQGSIRLMAVPANDFVKDDWIHARMAVMRGVENGFAIVRAAFNGLETISDAQGRILASASTTAVGMTVIRAAVPPGPGPTLYTRIGDVFAWLCVAAAVSFAVAGVRRRRAPA